MANPHRGEVAFKALGKDWVLRLGIDEIASAEAVLDLGIGEMLDRAGRGLNIRITKALLVAGLPHDVRGMSVDDLAVEVMRDIGVVAAMEIAANGIRAAFPPADTETDSANPQKAEAAE